MNHPSGFKWASTSRPLQTKRRTRRPAQDDLRGNPNCDFDDIGCSHIEREYRYAQAKRRGNFTFTRY